MVIAGAYDLAASKWACLRPFDRFDHHNKQLYIYWIQMETPGKGAPQTSFQQAMAAVAVPPMPITAFDPQMRNCPNIGRSLIKTSDFMA